MTLAHPLEQCTLEMEHGENVWFVINIDRGVDVHAVITHKTELMEDALSLRYVLQSLLSIFSHVMFVESSHSIIVVQVLGYDEGKTKLVRNYRFAW
jgi:hypothetical protein